MRDMRSKLAMHDLPVSARGPLTSTKQWHGISFMFVVTLALLGCSGESHDIGDSGQEEHFLLARILMEKVWEPRLMRRFGIHTGLTIAS